MLANNGMARRHRVELEAFWPLLCNVTDQSATIIYRIAICINPMIRHGEYCYRSEIGGWLMAWA